MRSKSGRQRCGSDREGGRSQAAAGTGRGGQAALLRGTPPARVGTTGHVGKRQPSIEGVILSKLHTIKDFWFFFFSKSLIIV